MLLILIDTDLGILRGKEGTTCGHKIYRAVFVYHPNGIISNCTVIFKPSVHNNKMIVKKIQNRHTINVHPQQFHSHQGMQDGLSPRHV